jgi:hypothetical protein
MSTQLNLDNNNPLSGVASSAKPDERYLVMLNGEAQIWDADRYNRNAQQLYADHAEDALAFKLDDGGGDLKAVLRQQLSAMEGVKDRYREAITGAQTYKDLLSIPGLAESQYLVTLGDEQQVWDAARLQRNGDRLMSDHPEAQISQLSYKDYWYDKALADEESIKAFKDEIDALKAEFSKQQRWSPEANALGSQIIERQSALDALQAGYDANPRVVEAKAKYDAEYAAALEEYKQNYLPNLRSQINAWKEEELDEEDNMLANIGEFLSAAVDPMDRGVIARGAAEAGYDTGDAMKVKEKVEQFDTGLAFLDKAERIRKEHSSFTQGFSNWAQGVAESKMTQSDLDAYTEIYTILQRLEKELGHLNNISEETLTQHLSKSEQALILGFFEYTAAQAEVQDSTRWEYKAGQIAGEAIPFILEFIATGGLTKAATKGATKGLSKALTSWIKKATKGSFRRTARKVVAKGVRGAAQGLTQAAMITPLRPTAYTNVTKAMTQIGKDRKLKDSGLDIAIAIADEYIETLSELSGGAITSVLGGLAKGTAKKFLSKNMYDTFATWGKRLANASGVKLLKSAQFHGLPVEIAEEYFGNTLRELYDAKALDKMHEDGNFAAMLLGFAPLTVLGAGVGMGQYVNAKNKVNKGAARLAGILAKDGFDKDQIDALIALEKELSPYSLAEKLDPVLTSMTKAGASKESRDAVIKYAMDVVRFKTLEGTVEAQESTKRQEKLDELTGKLGTFYQTKNEGTKWQENTVTQATLYDGRTVFLTSAKNEMGEFAAVDAVTGETLPVSESDIALVENAETGESSLAVESQSLDTYLTSLVMSERKTAEEMRMADERATQIAALQERLKADAKLNIGTSDAPVYLAYLPEQSNDGMAHFTMPDGTDTILTWDQVGDYLNQPIRVFTDAQLADAEAAELENEEARQRAENAETNEDMDKVEEAVEDAEELEEEANPVHIPMNPDGTVNTDLFWDQNPEEWVKWNDQQRQDNGVDSMAQIAAGLQTAEAKLAEASKLPFATPTQREARDKEMGFWQDKINRYNALLEKYQLAAAAQEAQMARAYAAERLEAAEAALADKMKQAPKRSDYRFTPQYMQAKQRFDAEVAALQEEVTRWQNELAQYGEMPIQQEEVVPEENVPVAEEQQAEEVAPTAEELAAQLDAMLMSGASRSDEAVVASMQAYADAIASGAPAKVVTRKNVMQVLKDAGVSETKMAEVKDALRRIQYIVNGFEANGVAYILADSVIISDNLRSTYVHERQHVMTALSGIDAALMTMTSREELQSAIAKMVGSDFYNGKGHKVLADELISMAMERAYRGENLDELFERIGLRNENAINFIKSIDDAQRNDSGLSLARIAEIGGNAAEGGSRQDGRTSLSGSTEMGEQGPRSVGRGGETAGDNTSGRGVGFSVSPNEGVAAMIENENGDAIAETNGGGDVRFSVLTYEQGGRDYLVNWLRKSKYMSKEERDFIIATLDQQYELAKRLGEEFPAFGAWSSAEVNVDKDGNPVMSVIKANGDYSMNLDFSLICKKRRPLNALLDVMIADRMLDMRSLNEAEIAKINKVIQRHGFEVACALCFVDSKRYRVVKVATDFADLYNELVNSLIPEGSGIEAVESNYAGYEYINERNAEKTGRRLETVPDAELNWAKVDEILEGVKTPKSVEEKVAWMLRNNPSQRKLVNATDFVTNLGFESVKKNNPELLKVYNAKKGTGGPKASFGDVQYLNDILKSRSFTPARAYSVGGVRVQSFSDYMGHMFFDYMQMVAELSAKGLPAHAYTKEEAFARIFGMTGMKINMSLVPAVADDGVAPGLDAQGNYVWAVPYTDENGNEIQGQTFPPEVAFELQRDPRYSKNVGIIAVGVSDEHILKMLNDDEIHFIIPYHKSSLNPEVAKMTKIDKYADYTNVQNTRLGWEYANLDKEQKKAELKKRAFDFYKSLAKTKDPKATAAEYLEHCRQNGLIPKYDQFSGHENYYKLLVDFNTYDFNTGEYAPQGPVTMTFPEELESLVKASVASNEELESDLKDKVGRMAEDVKAELGETRFSVSSKNKSISLQNNGNNEQNGQAAVGADTNGEWQANGSGVVGDTAGIVERNRDRSDIRVFEQGLESSRAAHSDDSERTRREAESERLVDLAKRNNLYIPLKDTESLGEKVQKRTGESVVYIDEETGRVFKVKDPYAKSAMKTGVEPEDAIYEHVVHNLVFPETPYKFVGISDKLGDVRIVLSQDYVESASRPTKEQIAEALASKGLMPETAYSFGNDLISVTDVEGDNVLLGEDGTVYFIDPIIRFKKPAEEIIESLSTRFSARTDEQRQALFDSAKAEYGVTDNFNIAGYMLPDGSLLNFADKDGEHDVRGIDHRNIGSIINDREYGSRWDYVTDFVNEGAIRIMPESNAVHLGTAPSAEQREKLLDYFYKNNGYMILELTDENGNNVGYMEYDEGTSPYRIMRDIDGYFNEGIVPQQDTRFSASNNNQEIFVSNAAKTVEGIKMEKATPAQWLAMLEKNGGLKAAEDKWMGLSDWLKESDKKTLTKAEVLDFINEHMIVIEEQHYGEVSEENINANTEKYLTEKYGEQFAQMFFGNAFSVEDDMHSVWRLSIWDDYNAAKLYNEANGTNIEVGEDGLGEDASEKIIAWGEGVLKEADNSLKTRPIHSTRRNYTTDGLENLHEIALTVPTIESWNEEDDIHFGDAGDGRAVAWIRFGDTKLTEVANTDYQPKNNVEREIKDYIEMGMSRWGYSLEECIGYAYNQITDVPSEAVGWTEKAVDNVAKGMRGETIEIAKVLVIDEIQSNRHQEGREKGYRPGEDTPVVRGLNKLIEEQNDARSKYYAKIREIKAQEGVTTWGMTDEKRWEQADEEFAKIRKDYHSASSALSKYQEEHQKELYSGEIPDAPFDKNWHELAMKRMLRYAAENGYDVIAWTKGAQQAERYNIGNVVEEISLLGWRTEGKDFLVRLNESDTLYEINTSDDAIIESANSVFGDVNGKPLSDLVGKEMADKMMSMHEDEKLAGEDLRVGGEGMRGFYDKMLPAFMNKYGKKWGIKVADITLPEVEEAGRVMHSVPVTEEMKASVMEGQVMFSIGNNPQTDAMNAKQLKVPGGMLTDEQMGVADIRFSITKNNRATIEKWLRMRKDLNPAEKRAFWMYIEDKAPAMQMAIGRWFAKGAIRLPEDLTAVEDAFKFAQKMRVNAMDYETPAAIIKDYADRFGKGKEKDKEKRELLSPDDERFNGILTNKVDYGNGIVVYDVQNDMVGQKAVRELINDHLGTDVNIWCLLYANAEGEPTEGAEKMWWHYNSTQKKVMFYNGEIAAFCASDKKDSEWWDLHDKSHGTRIPVQLPVEGDRLGRGSICEFDGKKILPPAKGERYFRGNKKKGRYEEWANKNASSIVLRTIRKGGKDDGLMEEWDGKGNLIYKGNYKASEAIGHHVHYASNGQVIKDVTYDQNGKEDGFSRRYEEDGNPIYVRQYVHGRPEGEWLEYENGKLKSTFTYENGILTGYQIEYDKKGKVVSQKYHNTYKDGNYTMTVTHENGPEGKIVGVKRRLKHDSPVIESLEIEERPGGWFKKPETTIYMRKGGTSIWYSDKEGLLSYYSYDQKSNERRSIDMSSEGIQVSFWPSNAVFNRKGRLLSFDGMTDSKSLAENRKEADRMWAFASDIMANAKDMAEGMENEILTKVQESEVRFSVVPHESSMDEVDSMFKQYNGDPFVRDLYGKVSELAHTMGLKISFAEGMGRNAGLNALDKIKYNVDYFNSPDVYAQDKAKTLLHELIHSVTRYAIYAKDAEFMSPRLKGAVAQLESIYDEIKNDPAFEDMYGATSVEEMVSELANVRFRAKLREKNLLQRIVDAIKDLLGIDKGTKALDNLSATLEDMIVNFDRAAYEQVRKDVSMQENYMRFSVDPAVSSEEGTRFSVVTDPMLVAKFESEPKIKVYRAMQLIDGKLYPPMSAKIDGKMREPIELGMWEQAEERPDLVDEKGNFKLDKGNKTSLKARYNPYFHTSTTPLNDQFSSAQSRPELVTVEVEVPASELTSGYKAENAKDAVGKVEWKAGVVQGKLSGTREVILSRWDKPIRIVPDSEVAAEIVKMFDGKDIIMPSNVVTPSLRAELEKLGVPFVETTNNGKLLTDIASMETPVWESKGTFENLAAAEEWADKNLKGKSEVNKFTGERISIGNKSVSKMLSEKSQNQSVSIPVHLAALQSVLDFIRTGIPAETHRDKQGRDFDVLRLYNAFEFDGHLYRVKSTVRKVKQGDKYYTYEVQEMELIEERQANWKGEGNNPRNPDSSINSITGAKLLKGVKKSNSNELILQESAEVPFSVSERPVDEIVNDGVQKASEEGKKAKASLKQRMDDIDSKLYYVMRLVANAQKNYDKKTVDIMTNLAKELMRDGALSDPTRGEINRLLSAIKNATGKADLTAAATTLMDVMVSNQLRHAKNTLAQMLKIKAKKVNASGVEVQGTLDLVGQRLIATVKESVGLTLEKIDERIADAKEKMDSEFETIKNNAAIDLVGLNIARKYVEGIVASEAEEKDLRKELESAQEDKKAGRMTAEGLREFRKATEDAIRQNRMERTSAYRSILSEMAKLITESVTKAGQFRDAEKERVEKIHHYANSDMQGMDAAEHVNNDQRLTNNPILRFFLKPLGTMDQMLRQMGSKHVNGEGYLWNHFMRGWLEATEKEYLGVSAAHKALDAKAKEVFGVKRWSDIFSIVRSLPSMHVKFWDGGKMRDHVLTQGNLLYIYMVNKMSDGKMKLRRMGIEEEQVRQMSMFMDPRLIEVGEWLQNEFLPGLRDKYNALHEKMFGAPMAAIDSYFPIKVLANARTREVDVATPEAEAKASTITGAIIKRTKNSLALDVLGSDALDVVLGHIQEMEHWAAFAEWNRDLNTLLSYKKFRNRVQNMSGLYGSGSTAWKNFRDACEVAAGVYKPASSGDAIDKTALNLAKGVTAGKISFRVFTAIKQLLSMPAFVSDASIMELGKSVATPWKSWNWAMKELPLFQKRWLSRQAGDSRLIATESDWKLWKTNFVEAASRYGMAPNAFVDALTVSIGAKAIYETKLAKYIENGYSVDAAEKKAKQDATILFNESQQSNEGAFLSAMQVDRSWVSVALTVFRNSSMGYQRMLVDALRNIKHRISKGYKDESIEFMAKQMVRDGLSEGQAQRAAERMYNRGFWHSMMRVGTFGFLVQFAWNLGAYLPYLVLGADDDEKEKMLKDASTHALLGGFVEGLSAGSLISEASNLIASGEGLKDYDPNLMPVVSDIKRLVQLWGTDEVAAANETLNLLGQMAIGVNPQTLTDIGVAIYDACDGDPQTAREATLLLARILQVPQSQTEQIFIDEIDFTVDKALDLTIEEFAQRYARYKRLRNTPLAVWMYSDEGERKVEDRYIKRFTKRAEELKRTRGNETAKAWYDYVDNEYKEIDLTIRELRSGAEKAAKKEDRVSVEEFAAKMRELMQTPEFGRYQQRAGKVKAVERLRQAMKDYPTKRDTLEDRMLEIRKQLVEEMQLAE